MIRAGGSCTRARSGHAANVPCAQRSPTCARRYSKGDMTNLRLKTRDRCSGDANPAARAAAFTDAPPSRRCRAACRRSVSTKRAGVTAALRKQSGLKIRLLEVGDILPPDSSITSGRRCFRNRRPRHFQDCYRVMLLEIDLRRKALPDLSGIRTMCSPVALQNSSIACFDPGQYRLE